MIVEISIIETEQKIFIWYVAKLLSVVFSHWHFVFVS